MSKSQLGQDLKVIDFYKGKKNGYFVEVGANDGTTLSNSFLLEKSYGWKGICCEPNPCQFQKLIKNRPNSSCCEYAIYGKSNEVVSFDIANDNSLLSGISNNIDIHKKSVDKNKDTILVKTMSLEDVLDKYKAPRFIDYISIDTEGSEYEILKPFNFNKYIFGLIDVEHNFVEPRRSSIRQLLINNGYVFVQENKWDDTYKHQSVSQQR
jgi:FkbM family methyltransferase